MINCLNWRLHRGSIGIYMKHVQCVYTGDLHCIYHLLFVGFLVPYLLRAVLRLGTPPKSSPPRTRWYLTPGKSCTRPPLTRTTECSWILWPSPGIYAVTVFPVVSLTRATLRTAEFGFFGFCVPTLTQTPFLCGQACRFGDLERAIDFCLRAPRITWLKVVTDRVWRSWVFVRHGRSPPRKFVNIWRSIERREFQILARSSTFWLPCNDDRKSIHFCPSTHLLRTRRTYSIRVLAQQLDPHMRG